MYVQIKAQTLAANALLRQFQLKKKDGFELHDAEIELSKLDEFSLLVVKSLCVEKNMTVLYISLEESRSLEYEKFTDVFEIFIKDGKELIRINKNTSLTDLYSRFGIPSYDVLSTVNNVYNTVFPAA